MSASSLRLQPQVTVKWLQIALILLALLVLNLFAVEAYLRRKTRPRRTAAAGKAPVPVDSSKELPYSERFASSDRF